MAISHRFTWGVLGLVLAGCVSTTPDPPEKQKQIADTNTQLAVQYLQRGQVEIALGRVERALEAEPDHSQANNVMGLIQWQLGKKDEAESYFKRSIDSNPNNSEAHNNYGVFLCAQDRVDDAVRQFEQALENRLYTARAQAEVNAGRCLEKKGDAKGAEAHFRTALAVSPKNRDALYEMAKLSFTMGQLRSAQGFLQRYLETGKPTADALLLAVRVETGLGNKSQRKKFAAQLQRDYPDSPQAKAIASTGKH